MIRPPPRSPRTATPSPYPTLFRSFTIVIAALWIARRGSPRLQARLGGEKAIWTLGFAFPAAVLTGLLIWGLTLTSSLSATRVTGDEMRVKIIGEMWWWRVHYLDAGGRETLRDAKARKSTRLNSSH